MAAFVNENSIVRKIWGRADTVMFVFAGAAAEFALNKAVDWLYFTGKLPADPLGRLFSTVTYARAIIFADEAAAIKSIDAITAIHKSVEKARGAQIPDWAYRDVLFMLIDYSIRSFEKLDRELTGPEKAEVFEVFHRVGSRMQLTGLPATYENWLTVRQEHLANHLIYSDFTAHLYRQYKKHLGYIRFTILTQIQLMLAPCVVSNLMRQRKVLWIRPAVKCYTLLRRTGHERKLRNILLPAKYKMQIMELDLS